MKQEKIQRALDWFKENACEEFDPDCEWCRYVPVAIECMEKHAAQQQRIAELEGLLDAICDDAASGSDCPRCFYLLPWEECKNCTGEKTFKECWQKYYIGLTEQKDHNNA